MFGKMGGLPMRSTSQRLGSTGSQPLVCGDDVRTGEYGSWLLPLLPLFLGSTKAEHPRAIPNGVFRQQRKNGMGAAWPGKGDIEVIISPTNGRGNMPCQF